MRRLSTTKQDHAGGSAKLASAASCPAVSRSLLTDPLFARPRVTLDKLAHQNAYQLAGYPDSYPDALFQNVVDVIIEMSEMHLPKWIANKGVKPKWNMT